MLERTRWWRFWESDYSAAVNELNDGIAMQRAAHDHMDFSLPRLFALDKLQGQEIAQLRTLVGVLIQMLVDSKAVDEDVLKYRLQAELEEAAQQAAASGDPYRGGPPQEAAPLACVACGKTLTLAEAAPTKRGPMCNPCFTTVP